MSKILIKIKFDYEFNSCKFINKDQTFLSIDKTMQTNPKKSQKYLIFLGRILLINEFSIRLGIEFKLHFGNFVKIMQHWNFTKTQHKIGVHIKSNYNILSILASLTNKYVGKFSPDFSSAFKHNTIKNIHFIQFTLSNPIVRNKT